MKRDLIKQLNPIEKRANSKIVDMDGRFFLVGTFVSDSRWYDNIQKYMRHLRVQDYESRRIKVLSRMAASKVLKSHIYAQKFLLRMCLKHKIIHLGWSWVKWKINDAKMFVWLDWSRHMYFILQSRKKKEEWD